jgi:hypothetical protein
MNTLTHEEIFDLLDGLASDELIATHQRLLLENSEYRDSFESIKALHETLATMPLESPSMAFENALMTKLTMASKRSSRAKVPVWIMLGLSVAMIAIAILWGDNSSTFTLPNLEQYVTNNNLKYALIGGNIVLGLLLLEKWWMRRKTLTR